MKKLAILASVVMIVTAPIMAQEATTAIQPTGGPTAGLEQWVLSDGSINPEQNKTEQLAPGLAAPTTDALVEMPPNGGFTDTYRAGETASTKDAPLNKSPSSAPTIK